LAEALTPLGTGIVGGRGNVVWSPQPGSQVLFLTCPFFECLYEGTRGPGKTDALLMDFAQHVGQGFGAAWRGILFRRTYKQLDDVVAKSKRWYRKIFPGAKFLSSKGDYKWVFQDGEELLLRVIDTPDGCWDYHGREYPWIGWEELTNWPNLDCYEAMKSCCRSSHPGIPRKYRSTCNPFGIGHNAVKAYFIDPAPAGVPITDAQGRKRVRLFGSIYENKILLTADPDYLKNLESITDENKRKAWLFGDWDITAGGALDDIWNRTIHAIPPFKIPATWRVDRAFDWGSSKPFSVGFWAQADGTEAILHDGTRRSFHRGTLIRIGEWYGWNGKANVGLTMDNTEIGKGIWEREVKLRAFQTEIRHIAAGPADSSIFTKMDGDSIYGKIQAGYRKASGNLGAEIFIEANKAPGSRKQGLDLLRSRLSASLKVPMENEGLLVFDTCTDGFLRTVPVLPRDEDDPDDIDSEAEDHAYDETRYRCLYKPSTGGTIKITGV